MFGLPCAGVLAIELLQQSSNFRSMDPEFPRSNIVQNLSVLISSMDSIIQPTHGNYKICSQAKKMLQTILDTVLAAPDSRSNATIVQEPSKAPEAVIDAAIDDQMWLEDNFDMEFWTNLEDHPLLIWPDVAQDSI